MLVQYVGLFMLGFHTGLLAGLVGLCCVELYYVPPTAWLTLGVLLATGLVFALLTLYFQVKTLKSSSPDQSLKYSLLQKSLTIFGSSFYGGAVLMTTTDYFIQESLVLDWVWERVKVDRIIDKNIQILDTIPKCWMAWAISAIWPFIFLLGIEF